MARSLPADLGLHSRREIVLELGEGANYFRPGSMVSVPGKLVGRVKEFRVEPQFRDVGDGWLEPTGVTRRYLVIERPWL